MTTTIRVSPDRRITIRFVVMLKFFELEGRFPADAAEVPAAALEYLAGQVKVTDLSLWAIGRACGEGSP
jgi:hypothetical protein